MPRVTRKSLLQSVASSDGVTYVAMWSIGEEEFTIPPTYADGEWVGPFYAKSVVKMFNEEHRDPVLVSVDNIRISAAMTDDGGNVFVVVSISGHPVTKSLSRIMKRICAAWFDAPTE